MHSFEWGPSFITMMFVRFIHVCERFIHRYLPIVSIACMCVYLFNHALNGHLGSIQFQAIRKMLL